MGSEVGSADMSGSSVMCSLENSSEAAYTRHLLDIEKKFDHCQAFAWLSANWTVCYYLIGAYLAAIFIGLERMKSRPPFQLRRPLLIWNVSLAAFSTVGAWRMLSAVAYSVDRYGFHSTVCKLGSLERKQAVALWLFLFTLSKIVEFGDTAFIVLRKTPLIFLHWYHHLTVAFFVWSAGAHASPMQYYFTAVNLLVHSLMYSYYALKGLGIRVPKPVSMAITSLQLLQMVVGILITGYMYLLKANDQSCQVDDQGIAIAASIYFSYLVLFVNFFVKTYLVREKSMCRKGDVKKLD